jgi:hypothetical protein
MLRVGRATVLVLNSSVDPVEATRRASGHGIHLSMVGRMDELVQVLPTAIAVVLCPPLRTADPFAVAAALRRRAPEMPVAILLGRGRVEGEGARVLWLGDRAVPGAITGAVGDLASVECSDEIELSWDGEVVDVAEILASAPHAPPRLGVGSVEAFAL